jgi:hypothetical protein
MSTLTVLRSESIESFTLALTREIDDEGILLLSKICWACRREISSDSVRCQRWKVTSSTYLSRGSRLPSEDDAVKGDKSRHARSLFTLAEVEAQ